MPSAATTVLLTLLSTDGSPGLTTTERPMPFSADDGSVPDLLFTGSGSGLLSAWDTTTGTQVWRSAVPVSSGGVLLDGRIYTRAEDSHLLALDAATGSTLWEQPLRLSASDSVFTDGRSLLAVEKTVEERPTLVAFAPADGRRRWEAPLPDTIDSAWWSAGGTLVGMSADASSIVVLG
jgi:outer membrane protein assembly factor BamB